jgi:Clostripain family
MPEQKPWAVLVYLVADDSRQSPSPSLDQIAEHELDLMFDACDRGKMHLAVQVDYRVKQEVWRHLRRDRPESLPESSAGDPATVRRFFDWAYDACPADRYLILFWGHAFGTAGLFPDSRPDAPSTRDLLSLQELERVLGYATRLGDGVPNVLMFKNCCLSNIETAYQLSESCELMLCSQALLPAKGWPYKGLFGALGAFTKTEEIGPRLLRSLSQFYAQASSTSDVPFALLRSRAARNIKEPMQALSEGLLSFRVSEAASRQGMLGDAFRRAGAVGDRALPDLVNLCRNLRDPYVPYIASIAEPALAVEQFVNRELVLGHFAKSSAFNGAGIFYRPDEEAERRSIVANAIDFSEYSGLAFCKDTGWSDVAMRPGEPGPEELSKTANAATLTR